MQCLANVSADTAKTMYDQIAFAVFSWILAILTSATEKDRKRLEVVSAQPIFFRCLSKETRYISMWYVLCGLGGFSLLIAQLLFLG